jgi:hypothetical protein
MVPVDGKWSAVGLADAVSKYAWSEKSFSENKAELDRFAADLRSAKRSGVGHRYESLPGQLRSHNVGFGMSALEGKADLPWASPDVGF